MVKKYAGKHLPAFCCIDGHKRARNSAALTVVDIMHTVFIELQVEQDAEKQDIQ